MNIRICAVIVSYQRTEWLLRCIRSLQDAVSQHPLISLEIRVLINGPDDASYSSIPSGVYADQALNSLTPAAARNQILKQMSTKGSEVSGRDWIYFIDDDAYVPKEIFTIFLRSVELFPSASVIGGPNLTPPGVPFFQKAVGKALSSRFGTVSCTARYCSFGDLRYCNDSSLILCNLFVKSDSLTSDAFREDLLCSEENWLLQNINGMGKLMLHNPELYVWHERRPSIPDFAKQIYKYGYGRGQVLRSSPNDATIFQLLPIFLVLLVVISPWIPVFFKLGCLYLLASFIYGIFLTFSIKSVGSWFRHLFNTAFLFPTIHLSYGFGILSGLAGLRWRRAMIWPAT